MTGQEALAILKARGRFAELGLTRMRRALAAFGEPWAGYAVVHVAGTNGKGSTSAFVEAILRRAGLRVGLFTSPPLLDERERVQVDRRAVDDAALGRLLPLVLEASGDEEADPLTEFELWTLLAFLHFAERRVDAAVVEVGLGGRFDATNVVPRPAVTILVSVALDHTDRLGDSLAAIAREKAGILKPDVPAVVGRLPEEAMAVVRGVAEARGAPLSVLGRDFVAEGAFDAGAGWRLRYRGERLDGEYALGLPGWHQVENAALAVRTAEILGVGEEAVAEGLRQAVWPGRLDRRLGGRVVLDGAHNPDACRALAASLATLFPGERFALAFGCLADRDPAALVAPLRPLAARLFALGTRGPRGRSAAEVARALPGARPADLGELLTASHEERLLVTGSLTLVAEALRQLGASEGEGRGGGAP